MQDSTNGQSERELLKLLKESSELLAEHKKSNGAMSLTHACHILYRLDSLAPSTWPLRALLGYNLGLALRILAQLSRDELLCTQAHLNLQRALRSGSLDKQHRGLAFGELAAVHRCRFDLTKDSADLSAAEDATRQAIAATSPETQAHAEFEAQLGTTLLQRHKLAVNEEDLTAGLDALLSAREGNRAAFLRVERAAEWLRYGIRKMLEFDPLTDRLSVFVELSDEELERAEETPCRAEWTGLLAQCLLARFERDRIPADKERALELSRERTEILGWAGRGPDVDPSEVDKDWQGDLHEALLRDPSVLGEAQKGRKKPAEHGPHGSRGHRQAPHSRDDSNSPPDPNGPAAAIARGWMAALKREISSEELAGIACDHRLAHKATMDSCEQLVRILEHAKGQFDAQQVFSFASLLGLHASALNECDRPREALFLIDAITPLMRAHGKAFVLASFEGNRSSALSKLGRHEEAVKGFDVAVKLFQQSGTPIMVASCQLERAVSLHALGKIAEAMVGFDNGRRLFEALGDAANAARAQANGASLLMALGRFEEALAGLDKVLVLLGKHGEPTEVANVHQNRAEALRCLGCFDESVEACNTAIQLFHQHGKFRDMARSQVTRASSLRKTKRKEEALQCFDEALSGLRKHGTPDDLVRCQMNLATYLFELNCFPESVAAYEQVDSSKCVGPFLWKFHFGLGDALWHAGERDRAIDHFKLGRKAARHNQRLGGIDETGLEFVAEWQRIMHLAVRFPLELGKPELAFEAVQDGKATLLDDLQQGMTKEQRPEPPGVHDSRRQLVEVLGQSPPPGLSHDQLPDERKTRSEAYLRVWRQARHPAVLVSRSDLPEASDSVSLAAIQGCLPEDWALLDFWQVDAEEFQVFVVTRGGLRVLPLRFPVRDPKLTQRLKRFFQSILDPFARQQDEVLYDLDGHLFQPLRNHHLLDGIRGLYLVPHGSLHALPLHAARRFDGKQDVYLCDDYAVAYLPSASLLPRLQPVQWNDRLLSLANPQRGTPHTLPFADWEANALHQRLQVPGEYHSGKQATYARTANWREASILHFSCHGLGDDSFAPLSRLYLSDDVLLAHDVLYRRPQLRNGSLVILNGCETGVPDWRAVNEGMGLMSAFLLRGAGLVLATQWSVFDACAAEIVLTFVDELVLKKVPPAEALRAAQRRARTMTMEEILRHQEEVRKLFPKDQHPHEAYKLSAQRASICWRNSRGAEARYWAEEAAEPMRQSGRGEDADRMLAVTRSETQVTQGAGLGGFNSPVCWSAFQLIGRVT